MKKPLKIIKRIQKTRLFVVAAQKQGLLKGYLLFMLKFLSTVAEGESLKGKS